MNHDQIQLIYGSLLGDANLGIGGRCLWPRLRISHSEKQSELVYAKYEILKEFVGTPPKECENGGWGKTLIRFSTLSQEEFADIYQKCYPDGKKQPSEEWLNALTPLGISWWFMDDGSRAKAGVQLSTEGFNLRSHQIMQTWFREKWGITASIQPSKRDLVHLGFNKENGEKLSDLVRPHIIPTLRYKLYKGTWSECVDCGKRFTVRLPNTVRCSSPDCRKAAEQLQSKKWYLGARDRVLAANKIKTQNRRSQKKCAICGQPPIGNVRMRTLCGRPECKEANRQRVYMERYQKNHEMYLEKAASYRLKLKTKKEQSMTLKSSETIITSPMES